MDISVSCYRARSWGSASLHRTSIRREDTQKPPAFPLDLLSQRRYASEVQEENWKGTEKVPCQSLVLPPFIFQSLRDIKIDLKRCSKFLLFKEHISAA